MSEEKQIDRSQLNIMIVDDEENLGNMLVMVLRAKGYNADSCTSSTEALSKIRTMKYHIIISDIKMPEMTGIELLRRIREISSLTQVIMITGFSSLEVALECLEVGAEDFLFKPFENLDELYSTIDLCARKVDRWRKICLKAGKINRLDQANILH